jgi:hypothetical protein
MAYGQGCETIRFAWRNMRFAFAVLVQLSAPSARTGASFEAAARAAGQWGWELRKLRKGAAKSMKLLARVNLCAGQGWGAKGANREAARSQN